MMKFNACKEKLKFENAQYSPVIRHAEFIVLYVSMRFFSLRKKKHTYLFSLHFEIIKKENLSKMRELFDFYQAS